VLQDVGQDPDVFVDPLKSPIHMEVLKARSHVVAFWVGAHELCQTFEPVANQLRLAQLLGHRRYALVRRPELGVISFHRHLPFGFGTFYATTGAG
jgi:hypothetical protein